jgi:hypothetical protein
MRPFLLESIDEMNESIVGFVGFSPAAVSTLPTTNTHTSYHLPYPISYDGITAMFMAS